MYWQFTGNLLETPGRPNSGSKSAHWPSSNAEQPAGCSNGPGPIPPQPVLAQPGQALVLLARARRWVLRAAAPAARDSIRSTGLVRAPEPQVALRPAGRASAGL